MRWEAAAGLAICVFVVSAMVGFYQGTTASHVKPPPSPCSSSLDQASLYRWNSSSLVRVFQTIPGSTPVVCVSYQFQSGGSIVFASGPLACGDPFYQVANGTEATNYPCDGSMQVLSSPAWFNYIPGQTFSVAFTLSPSANASGVFWINVPSCGFVPVVSGALPSRMPPPPFHLAWSGGLSGAVLPAPYADYCFSHSDGLSLVNITGVSGLGVALVPIDAR